MKRISIVCMAFAVLVCSGSSARSQCPPVRFQHYDGTGVEVVDDPILLMGEGFGIVVDGLPPEHFPIEVTRIGFGVGSAVGQVVLQVYDTWPQPQFFPSPTYAHSVVSATAGLNEYDVTASGPMLLNAQPFVVLARNGSSFMTALHDGNGCSGAQATSVWHYVFVPPGWFNYCPGGAGDWVFWIEYRPAYAGVCLGVPSFCDGSDGSLAACPCGNAGDPDSGCDIAQATGGIDLQLAAQSTVPANRATLSSSGYPATSNPTAVLLRAPALDPSSPVVFGDGLRCVAVPLVRVGASVANNGTAEHTFGHGAMAGAGTHFYQLWLRNNPAMFCTPESFNMSQGRALTW